MRMEQYHHHVYIYTQTDDDLKFLYRETFSPPFTASGYSLISSVVFKELPRETAAVAIQ